MAIISSGVSYSYLLHHYWICNTEKINISYCIRILRYNFMKGLELFIVVGYAALMIIIGLYYRKKAAKSSSSFWSAEASVPIVVNAFCLFATVMSGGGMMGNIGLAAATGIVFILSANLGSGCGLGMGAMLVARPLRKSGAKTVSEFIQMRYE